MSDHSPINLCISKRDTVRYTHYFRFENSWLMEEGMEAVVGESWAKYAQGDVVNKLKGCSQELDRWGGALKTRFTRDINRCKGEIDSLLYYRDSESEAALSAARYKLGVLLLKEEDYWRQRAKVYWLQEGDRNTNFFHAMASQRKRRSVIHSLRWGWCYCSRSGRHV